jgi:Skp family chaperone for outer membrane proteins
MKNNPLRSRCAPSSDPVMRNAFIAVLALVLMGPGQTAFGQSATALDRGSVISPVLTIDSDRLFTESRFGQEVVARLEAQGSALATENRQIEADLETEERDLTEKRATMVPEEFRVLADAFDKKVQETRAAQAVKGRALTVALDQEREVFLTAAAPVLERLMREAGAVVILERRSVFVSASAIEITDDAIALLDETLARPKD